MISENAHRFINDYIHSVEQLEIICTLNEQRGQPMSIAEIYDRIKTNRSSISHCLAFFAAKGLVAVEANERYGLSGKFEALTSIATELRAAYRSNHVAVIELIYDKRPNDLQIFAEAFKLKKEK